MKIICNHCTKEFEGDLRNYSRQKYCSPLCRDRAFTAKKKEIMLDVISKPKQCEQCGNAFVPAKQAWVRQRFCSAQCKSKNRGNSETFIRRQKIDALPEKECPICKIMFKPNSFKQQTTCSKSCSHIKWRVTANRVITKEKAKHDNLRRYGVTYDKYQEMFTAQNGLCKICNQPPSNKSLAVDHCHTTGKVRGLLCSNCNTAIGLLKDNTQTLKNAINYLTF